MFDKVPTELDFPKEEREILALWKEQKVFETSLEERAGSPTFVFYEGPPTANGMPHNGHVLTRVVKDLFPRYKTMRGFHVPRKAGWDTHGLPVEVEVEKELRIHGKAAIEAYGVEPFVKRCIESVFRYTDEWEKLTERIGFWVDLPNAYVTFHKSYVESVWWALSELFNKGLLYQGHKVVWWWAQGGTALSSGEVGLGYKEVFDPSVYVAFPLVDALPGESAGEEAALLLWTTTPWTLPSNSYVAVNTKVDYVVARLDSRRVVIAKALLESFAKKLKVEAIVERELKGDALVGKRYRPPFDLYYAAMKGAVVGRKSGDLVAPYWRVIAADFVTLDAGTGIVHVAPAFGEDDFTAHRQELASLSNPEAVPLLCAVRPDGTFGPELPPYAGRWVKDCDKEITQELKERGLLVLAETYKHDYPFCWRADSDPLIQYARPAWYIKTTAVIDRAIENNQRVDWLPDHIKDGRFGDFLAHNVDWALSRERYWGTPLNVWINDVTGKIEAPSSVAEILKKNPGAFDHFHAAKKADPSLSEHLIVHKPWVDQVTWQNPGEEGTFRRVPEVIDCWFDSGCMPFAQWGFPHTGHEEFKRSFPADFISEAIDQTRGWFYSLLMISTLVWDKETQARLGVSPPREFPHPYKTCIVLGHVSDKEGKKESKSKGNYTPPEIILDEVRMDFAVWGPAELSQWKKDGVLVEDRDFPMLFIAKEDFEGMDLREDGPGYNDGMAVEGPNGVEIRRVGYQFAAKGARALPRRVIVLDQPTRDKLGVKTAPVDVKPVDVPRLPKDQRVAVRDPSTPAPGADAFRWFFYASNPPWNATRHSLSNVRALQKEFLVKLRNVYSFFTIYANIDGFDPHGDNGGADTGNPPELDRWLESELSGTVMKVGECLDAYDVYRATQVLTDFVDALSNWYVRRSRDRFWRAGWDADKASAYRTLYASLVTLSALTAPFTPFMAERMHQNLVVGPARRAGKKAPSSVHLAAFPTDDGARYDAALSRKFQALRDIVSVGLQVRTQHKLKVRQPLRAAHLILNDAAMGGALAPSAEMIREELNVLDVHFTPQEEAGKYGQYTYKPNFRTLGQRGLGKQAQDLKKAWAKLSPEDRKTLDEIRSTGKGTWNGVDLLGEDIEAFFETTPGFAAAGARVGVVVLETGLDDELRDMGLAREIQSRVQAVRKEIGLQYTDRIDVTILGGERVRRVIAADAARFGAEVLARTVSTEGAPSGASAHMLDVEGERIEMYVQRAG